MRVFSSNYTGDGNDDRSITGVGFQPDAVIIKRTGTSTAGVFSTSAHPSDETSFVRQDTDNFADGIQAFESDGFQLGTNSLVNGSGADYAYVAIGDDGGGEFAVGSYTGNGSDGLAITGVGFQPDYVFIKSDSDVTGAHRYAGNSDTSVFFAAGDKSDLIVTLDSDGFTVNDGSGAGFNPVNVNTVEHYYLCFKETTGAVSVFNYTGNNADDRSITTPDFEPEWVHIKQEGSQDPALRTDGHVGDASQAWDNAEAANGIQDFLSTGFEIGDQAGFGISVNQFDESYYAIAINDNPAATGITSHRQLIGVGQGTR